MLPRLLILGYGRLGQSFYRKYRDFYEIRGIRRTPLSGDSCPLTLASIQSDAILPHLRWADVVLFCPAPGKSEEKNRGKETEFSLYHNTYTANMVSLIDRIRSEKVELQQLILISSTGVYPRYDGGLWTEDSSIPLENERQWILADTEYVLMHSNVPYVILRCGGLCGEGRDNFSHLSRRKQFLTSEMSDELISQVDQEDVCDVIHLVTRKNIRYEIFNLVNDTPLVRRDLYRWAAAHYGIPIVDDGPAAGEEYRTISNEHVKKELGFRFREKGTDLFFLISPSVPEKK